MIKSLDALLLDRSFSSTVPGPEVVFVHNVVYTPQSSSQGQGDADSDAVSLPPIFDSDVLTLRSGLDNAGKTTIVKRIMNEDVNSVSPTLGFIIKTIDYDG